MKDEVGTPGVGVAAGAGVDGGFVSEDQDGGGGGQHLGKGLAAHDLPGMQRLEETKHYCMKVVILFFLIHPQIHMISISMNTSLV